MKSLLTKSLTNSVVLTKSRHQRRGSALIITLVTLAVLAAVVSAISVSVSTTANMSLQAASWQEAIMAAEAGADTAMACFRVALDDGGQNPTLWNAPSNALSDWKTGATAWRIGTGWIDPSTGTAPTPTGTPTKIQYAPVFRQAGTGTTGLQATVTIDAPAGWTTTDGAGNAKQWYRVRSTGVSGVTGPARVGSDKRDNDLHKINLVNMRGALSGFPAASLGAGVSQVSRSVELIIMPLKSGLWDRAITATSPTGGGSVNLGAGFTTDSWDSSNTAKYPGGLYDATKRQANADLASNANGMYVEIGGSHLYGDVLCNGGTPKHTQNVTGTITTNFFNPASDITTPTWANTNTGVSITQNTPPAQLTLTGGSQAAPQRYSYSGISLKGNTLTCAPGANGGYIEIYVDNDFNMTNSAGWVIQPGANVSVYIKGKFAADGSSTVANQTNNCANLSLFGIAPQNGNPQWSYNGGSDFSGTIWAPEVKLKISGSANFFGAVMVCIFDTGGTVFAGFHFDEALLKGGGATPKYTVASWVEDVR